MNREIKFRAWDETFEEMLYPNEHGEFETDNRSHFDYTDLITGYRSGIVPMQNTGLKDKNGVEIYGGDIVSGILHYPSSLRGKEESGVVKYCDRECRFRVVVGDEENGSFSGLQQYGVIEVIGNIYENPELLKEVTP